MTRFSQYSGFLATLVPAGLGGAVWAGLGLPLGWLMGAAIVTGSLSYFGFNVALPKWVYRPSLAVIGAGVGLTITPSVALEVAQWLPLMLALGLAGVVFAAALTPWVAKKGKIGPSTAFFSLMPGGVIEMANIGESHGADRTTIATLHAIRVALVVGILPLGLFLLFPTVVDLPAVPDLMTPLLVMVIAVAVVGGMLGRYFKLPAAWLLGSLLAVAVFTSAGVFEGQIPSWIMAIAQVFVGISLGAKFQREQVRRLPRAMAAGGLALMIIIMLMAVMAIGLSTVLPIDEPTMVLAMSIGGMAEMVLTARALELDMAIVAAFQAVRAILVNSFAGFIWGRYSNYLNNR